LAAERTTAQASLPLARASASADDVAEELARFARQLRRPRMRARLALLAAPGAARVFVAFGVTITITAPSIAHWQGVATLQWHGVALACLVTAWLFVVLERLVQRDLETASANVRLADAGGYVISSAPAARASGGDADTPNAAA
ncbi:MAG: hypothetical protein H7287_00865, partial [Thermoleophilia bacterium]|nr:hypothetical protein [Thermoleophilia bacterium]